MKARSDTLPLGWRNWEVEEEKICALCRVENETLLHFLLNCNKLQEERNKCIELQRPVTEDTTEITRRLLLLTDSDITDKEYYIDIVWCLWKRRKQLRKLLTDD